MSVFNPTKAGKRTTVEDREKIIKMYLDHVPVPRIILETGFSDHTIYRLTKNLRSKKPRPPVPADLQIDPADSGPALPFIIKKPVALPYSGPRGIEDQIAALQRDNEILRSNIDDLNADLMHMRSDLLQIANVEKVRGQRIRLLEETLILIDNRIRAI